jgi:hypothetical protein
VIALKPTNTGYLEEVRTLVEKIDGWMRVAEDDAWSVAFEVQVAQYEDVTDDLPF